MNLEDSFETSFGKMHLAPFQKRDIDALVSYLCDSSLEFLMGIGFSREDIPEKELYRNNLIQHFEKHPVDEYMIVGIVEQKTISAVYLDLRGKEPHAHFHIYDEKLRGKGLGELILKRSLRILMDHHKIDELFLEPNLGNIAMNNLMRKCGFEFVKESVYESATQGSFDSKKYRVRLKDVN